MRDIKQAGVHVKLQRQTELQQRVPFPHVSPGRLLSYHLHPPHAVHLTAEPLRKARVGTEGTVHSGEGVREQSMVGPPCCHRLGALSSAQLGRKLAEAAELRCGPTCSSPMFLFRSRCTPLVSPCRRPLCQQRHTGAAVPVSSGVDTGLVVDA